MKREPKLKKCKACGEEIAAKAKSCPYCGAKNGTPIYKRWWFWVITALVVIGAATSGGDNSAGSTGSNPPEAPSQTEYISPSEEPKAEEPEENTPDIELSSDFERAVYNIVINYGGRISSIETVNLESTGESNVIAGILCENDEGIVNGILSQISEEIKNGEERTSMTCIFGDIKESDSAKMLVTAGVYTDGSIDISYTSSDYNSERNRWISSQFSAWNGAHKDLEKLIIKNLNDEKSYKHIETTYRDIATESDRDDVNKVLEESGYSQRVEVGDLFIQTIFSAKNAFGGTVKNTAYGIASYSSNTITLIDIG